jgi:hypothetical protein
MPHCPSTLLERADVARIAVDQRHGVADRVLVRAAQPLEQRLPLTRGADNDSGKRSMYGERDFSTGLRSTRSSRRDSQRISMGCGCVPDSYSLTSPEATAPLPALVGLMRRPTAR